MGATVGAQIWIVRRKYPNGQHYEMQATVLGEDEHGTWAGATPGWTLRHKDGRVIDMDSTMVWCVPHDDWFLAHLMPEGGPLEAYVDICTPATWSDDRVVVIDLDLDLDIWRDREPAVVLVDEDEFAEHQVTLGYPSELIADTEAAAADVLARARRREAPFTTDSAAPWFAALAERRARD